MFMKWWVFKLNYLFRIISLQLRIREKFSILLPYVVKYVSIHNENTDFWFFFFSNREYTAAIPSLNINLSIQMKILMRKSRSLKEAIKIKTIFFFLIFSCLQSLLSFLPCTVSIETWLNLRLHAFCSCFW